ncbi:MAG: DUF2066 domain-containing protein [Thiohalomonadaceae bacterium]
MNRIRLVAALFLALLAVRTVAADEIRNLYEAEVPVAGQGAEERRLALRASFEVVLAKVSGYGAVASEQPLAEALDNPDRYVQQFLYRDPVAGQTGLTFWARFDHTAVNALLRSHRLPVWGAVRPATLLWLAVDERGRRRLVGANDPSAIASTVAAFADRRGLPVHFPLLDLQDLRRIQPSDVWGDFRDVIEGASARYNAQAILSGALARDGDYYRARFTLYQDGNALRWESAGSLEEVIAAGLGRATDEIAQGYSHTAGGATQVTVQVRSVQSLEDYMRAMDYLDALSGVSRVELVTVEADSVTYRLTLQGATQALVQAIALGDTLVPDAEAMPVPSAAEYRYRLLK